VNAPDGRYRIGTTLILDGFSSPVPSTNSRLFPPTVMLRLQTLPDAQQKSIVRVFDDLRTALPDLRWPTMGPHVDAQKYVLEWSFTDRPHLTLEIEVDADGNLEWFFRDGESFVGSDGPLEALPREVSRLARRLQ
jgi:hypothetical protein